MAYCGTYYAGGNAMTSSCIDGVPFKLGPKFKPPTKVILPADLDLSAPSRSSLLHEEYSFEVEEAVLKWSAERERQLEEQQRQASERQASLQRSRDTDSSDSGTDMAGEGANNSGVQPIYQNVTSDPNYENGQVLRPQPAPRSNIPKVVNSVGNPTYTAVTIPNPLIANISNDILQPTPISKSETSVQNIKRSVSKEKKDFDVSWFEKEDDPFDNLELQTINDMEELASVLEETKKVSPVIGSVTDNEKTNPANLNGTVSLEQTGASDSKENGCELPLYENSQSSGTNDNGKTDEDSVPVFDIKKLPPVPPRRDLVGRNCPLPPIGRKSVDSALDLVSQSQNPDYTSGVSSSQTYDNNISVSSSFPKYENSKTISPKPPVPKPPRTFKYSRHDFEETASDSNASGNNENLHVQSRNAQSNPDLKSCVDGASCSQELNFVNHHFGENANQEREKTKPVPAPRRVPSPPARPSSQQSWNRYSPLPTPVTNQSPEPVMPPRADAYTKLSTEARTSVDSLVNMGFSKDRVIRAVEKLGEDQKEVVEYLCLVDQLTEKGFDISLAENALLLFQNSTLQASKYLELYKQFQELGFHGDQIKDALVNTKNDREKSLDILTASS